MHNNSSFNSPSGINIRFRKSRNKELIAKAATNETKLNQYLKIVKDIHHNQVEIDRRHHYLTLHDSTLKPISKEHSMSQKYLRASKSRGKLPNAKSFASSGKKFTNMMKASPKQLDRKKQVFKYVTRQKHQVKNPELILSPQNTTNSNQMFKVNSSKKLYSYSKYLVSSSNKPKKLGYSQSTMALQPHELEEDSKQTESDQSSITVSGSQAVRANKIHIFPNKKLMPSKKVTQYVPQEQETAVLNIIKDRINGGGIKRYSGFNETDPKCQNSARSNGKLVTEASSTKKNTERTNGKRHQEADKELRSHYLKELVDPDKHSNPKDRKFKGFSFVQKSLISSKTKKKTASKTKVFSMSPKDPRKRKADKEAKIRKM